MKAPGEVALFRLENTLMRDVIGHTASIAAEVDPRHYGDIPTIADPSLRAARVVDVLRQSKPWFIRQLAEQTSQTMSDNLAPWAAPIIYDQHANHHREIGIYSDFLTGEVVRAYANGIEDTMLGVQISYVQGARPNGAYKRFIGETKTSSANELATLLSSQGMSLGMVATGANNALDLLQGTPHPLLVNTRRHIPVNGSYHSVARLNWDRHEPGITRFARPYEPRTTMYDLSQPAARLAFVEAAHEAL